ncbi:hypothetical protein VM98_37420, partial [Streptomyces rubellomurinus subsp. indigoferus]
VTGVRHLWLAGELAALRLLDAGRAAGALLAARRGKVPRDGVDAEELFPAGERLGDRTAVTCGAAADSGAMEALFVDAAGAGRTDGVADPVPVYRRTGPDGRLLTAYA